MTLNQMKLLQEACLKPRVNRIVFEHFGVNLPSENELRRWLLDQEWGDGKKSIKFSESGAKTCARVLWDSFDYCGLVAEGCVR